MHKKYTQKVQNTGLSAVSEVELIWLYVFFWTETIKIYPADEISVAGSRDEKRGRSMKRKRKWHRVISLLLAAVMVLSLMQVRGWTGTVYAGEIEQAEEQPDTGNTGDDVILEASATETYVPDASGLPDSDELFAGYAMQVFYGDSGVALLSNFGEAELDGYNLILYRALKEGVADLAAEGGEAQVVVNLGDDAIPVESSEGGNIQDAMSQAFAASGIDLNTIMSCLLADCPYELYWYDKTQGVRMGYSAGFSDGRWSISAITFTFAVSAEYRGTSTDPEVQAVDPEKAGATASAAETARAIAKQYRGYSDYAKMIAFRDAICNLVDYNAAAAGESYTGGYGDPWQLIYVFDGDDSTNVVCEGYAKAFQYLCDLSGLTCYTVTGAMAGGTGEGPHMWNIVTLGGENYLVDVTNSDAGTVGQNGGLFLAGYDSGIWNESYTFQVGEDNIAYAYDQDQRTLYGEKILTLAATDYAAAGTEEEVRISVLGVPEDGIVEVEYGTAPQLEVTVEGLPNTSPIAYQWYQMNEYGVPQMISGANAAAYAPTGLALGDYTYYCLVTCDGYEVTSPQVTVKVEQAVLTPSIQGTTTKTYDGNTNAPSGLSISLDGIVNRENVTASAESYSYNSKDVESAETITASGITLSGTDSGNYKLASTTATDSGSIAPRAITVTPNSGQSKAYGANDPVLQYEITNGELVSGEALQGALSRDSGDSVGKYNITIGTLQTKNPNYSITLTEGVTFEITSGRNLENAQVTVNGTYTYNNGTPIIPDVTVVLDGVMLEEEGDYTVSASNNTNAGENAEYTVTGTGNYSGSKTGTFTIDKADPVCDPPIGLTAAYSSALSTVTLTNPDGNTPGIWQWENGNETVALGVGSYDAVFNPDDTANYNSQKVKVTVTGTDNVAPTGKITIAGNEWTEFLNTITFGHFFKETQDVTITGTDNTGKDVTIEYLLTDTKQTEASLENADWMEYSQVLHIEENQKLIVYARITDASDNSTVINSDGIVLYSDAQAVTQSVTYTRTSNEDVTARVNLNSNTVAGIANGSNSLRAGTDYTVSNDGTITLNASYLQTLAANTYTLTVSYNPLGMNYTGGEGNQAPATTSLSLVVVKAQGSVTDISNLSKIYDSDPVGTPTYTKTSTGAATVEYKKQDTADSTYTTAAPEDAGDYTVRVTVAADDDYTETSATRNFTISPRDVTITGTAVESTKEYDGTTAAEITNSGTLSWKGADDDVSISGGTAAYADKNAEINKSVTFTGFALAGGDKDNYNLTAQPAAVQADITKKELTVNVTVSDKVYDGTDTAQIASAELEGLIEGDQVELTNGTATFASTAVGQNIPINFTDFSISGADAGNYTLTQPTGVTANIAEYVAEKGTDYTVNSNGWLREDFVVTAGEGRLLSRDAGAAAEEWTDGLTAGDETAGGNLVFYVKNTENGAISTAVTETYQIDKTDPTGTVSIGGQNWSALQNVDSFDIFFGTDQAVNITANDTLSGIASSEYYVSPDALSAQQVEAIEGWTSYSTLTLDQEGEYIVYVKITDAAGNTAYLSSDGVVLDKTAPTITGIENNGTYYGSASFTVGDDYLSQVTIDNEEAVEMDGTYTIPADNENHTVTATDKADNTTTYTVAVYKTYTLTLPASPEGYTVQTETDRINYGGSYTFTVEITDGYSATEDFQVQVNGSAVTAQADGSYLVTNVQEDQVVTVAGVADVTAPDAGITVGSSSWRSFLNTITFDLFFKETQTVEIAASDAGSGVDTIRYYVSETALSEDEVKALADTAWNNYSSTFFLDSEREYVIYAKVTDEAGNAVYISSDGMVIDLTAPELAGIADGATYYDGASFTVSDSYLDRVTVDGEPIVPTDGVYSIEADNAEHTVTAYDRAGNSRTYNIRVYKTYTVTFVADGVTVDTRVVGYGGSLGAKDYPAVPEKEGYTQIPPSWYPGTVTNVTGDMTVMAVYFTDNAVEIAQPGTAGGVETKLVVEQGVPTVPEALENNEELNTAEKIEAALQTVITQKEGSATEENTVLYDVTLMVNLNDGNGWIPAGPEHFAADGTLTVTLPYLEGTGKDTHDFTVAHMFTTSDFGKTPGDIETPAVVKTDAGIRFTVTGLSPIMVSWTEAKPADEGADNEIGQDAGTTAGVAETDENSGQKPPETGDTGSAVMLYTALAVCVSGMLAALMLYRKRKNNSDR